MTYTYNKKGILLIHIYIYLSTYWHIYALKRIGGSYSLLDSRPHLSESELDDEEEEDDELEEEVDEERWRLFDFSFFFFLSRFLRLGDSLL